MCIPKVSERFQIHLLGKRIRTQMNKLNITTQCKSAIGHENILLCFKAAHWKLVIHCLCRTQRVPKLKKILYFGWSHLQSNIHRLWKRSNVASSIDPLLTFRIEIEISTPRVWTKITCYICMRQTCQLRTTKLPLLALNCVLFFILV